MGVEHSLEVGPTLGRREVVSRGSPIGGFRPLRDCDMQVIDAGRANVPEEALLEELADERVVPLRGRPTVRATS